MTRYNTGNPVGSSSPLDLYDNAENLDAGINGPEVAWVDRRGQTRKSWTGVETDFQKFLADGSTIEFPTWEAAAAAAGAGQIPVNRQVAVIGDVGFHIDPVTGTEVPNQGRYVMTAGGLQWRARDVVSLKADNTTTGGKTGATAILVTEGGDVLVALDASGRRRMPNMSMSDGIEMAVRDDISIPGVEQVTLHGGRVTGYRHALGDDIDFLSEPVPSASPMTVLSGAAHERQRIFDAAYNQWVFPTFCTMNGRKWLGSVAQGSASPEWFGGLSVNERIGAAAWMQYEFGRQQFIQSGYQTDDHNAPAVALDPRPNAKNPVLVMQADHSLTGSRLRCWRSPTTNAAGVGGVRTVSMADTMSYAQVHRNPFNPNEIIAFSRQGGSSSAVWMIYRSADEMDSVHAARFIAGDDLYMMTKPTLDGLGLHIGIQQHPNNGLDQRVLYMRYLFADSSLRDWQGNTIAADAFATGAFDPYSPMGLSVIYTPSAGRFKRLFDMQETSEGVLEFAVVDFEKTEWSGNLKHIRVADGGAPVVTQIGAEGSAGNPMELTNQQAYFAGMCIAGPYTLIAAAWNRGPQSSELTKFESTDGGATWVSTQIASGAGTDQKLARPTILVEYFWSDGRIHWKARPEFVYLVGRYYNFLSYYFDAVEASL